MATNPSAASVPQTVAVGNVNERCPRCGSKLVTMWAWVGGRGERETVRCTMTNAPSDGNGGRWCAFGMALDDYLMGGAR